MSNGKLSRRQLLKAAGALGAAAAIFDPAKVFADEGQVDGRVTWDIISLSGTPPFITITGGGSASATSTDGNHVVKAKITVTGHGTFPNTDKCSKDVTGGGTWSVSGTTDAACFPGSGNYRVIELLSWHPAGGTFPTTFTDNTGDKGTPSSGLATLRVHYDNGRRGTLTVSCHLPAGPTPACIFEGITGSVDYEDFWQSEAPAASPAVPGNRTLFHVSSNGEGE